MCRSSRTSGSDAVPDEGSSKRQRRHHPRAVPAAPARCSARWICPRASASGTHRPTVAGRAPGRAGATTAAICVGSQASTSIKAPRVAIDIAAHWACGTRGVRGRGLATTETRARTLPQRLTQRLHRGGGLHPDLVEEQIGEVAVEGEGDADGDRGEEEDQVGSALQQPQCLESENIPDACFRFPRRVGGVAGSRKLNTPRINDATAAIRKVWAS